MACSTEKQLFFNNSSIFLRTPEKIYTISFQSKTQVRLIPPSLFYFQSSLLSLKVFFHLESWAFVKVYQYF